MGFIDFCRFVVLIVVDAIYTSVIFFASLTVLHFMILSAMWVCYLPEAFMCPMVVFTTFVTARNTEIIAGVTYVPAYF
jgi:hypothetical protein